MMEKIIKDHIWAMAKTDGRLVSRTCYGVQYHALMLVCYFYLRLNLGAEMKLIIS